ncbi:MAG: acetylornithine deacetylase [Blastopirellula sp.]|nr:MAG: acetylornithine deacetylase [Blastopirellula sp.]
MTENARLYEKISSAIDREYAVELLQGAVARASVTGNEVNFVDYLHECMTALKLSPNTADFLPGRPNIWGKRQGSSNGPNLLFVGHTDTVHVRGWEERWAGTERENPFGGTVVDGEMWGRGTGDLKAGICASLAAVDLLDKANINLKGDLSFAFIGDEESGEPETGVSAGIKDYTARTLAGEIEKPDFAIYVEPTRLAVYPAQMGFFIAEIKITGKSAYFGVPEQGIDALKASHKALSAIWNHSEEISQRASHPLVGRAFALVTEIASGGYIAVPGDCFLSLIRKLLPGENLDEAVKELEASVLEGLKGENVQTEFTYPAGRDHQYGGSPTEIDADLPEVSALAKALRDASPGHGPKRGQIEGAPYWSEAPFLINQIGCPAVYCAPGDITNCHTLEERVNVDEYVAGIIAFACFIASYCGTTNA